MTTIQTKFGAFRPAEHLANVRTPDRLNAADPLDRDVQLLLDRPAHDFEVTELRFGHRGPVLTLRQPIHVRVFEARGVGDYAREPIRYSGVVLDSIGVPPELPCPLSSWTSDAEPSAAVAGLLHYQADQPDEIMLYLAASCGAFTSGVAGKDN